ncbi:MAG: SDR family oxidoreductase [Pirellulaceae bacterium]
MQPSTRVVVVTGSSSGIGQQTALEFASQSCAIVLHGRASLALLQSTAIELRRAGATDVLCVVADIADIAACRDLVQCAFAWRGHVDVWVNNAGVDVLTRDIGLGFDARLRKLLDVDVSGTLRVSRLVTARWLLDRRHQCAANQPCLVNMGWDQALLGMEGEAGQLFCTSKGAVMAFTQALAMSCGPHLRVNCVAPGWIKTAWGEQAASEYWETRATLESLQERWGTPQDVAKAIAWLCSPAAQFINGQILNVNGGRRFYGRSSVQ